MIYIWVEMSRTSKRDFNLWAVLCQGKSIFSEILIFPIAPTKHEVELFLPFLFFYTIADSCHEN